MNLFYFFLQSLKKQLIKRQADIDRTHIMISFEDDKVIYDNLTPPKEEEIKSNEQNRNINYGFNDLNKVFGVFDFKNIPVSVDDIKALGRIKVVGTATFQDKQQIAQALQMLGQNPLFIDEAVRNNFSPKVLGQIFSYVTGLDRFPNLYKNNQRLYEITSQQKLVERLSQQVDEEKAEGIARTQEAANQFQIQQKKVTNSWDGTQI